MAIIEENWKNDVEIRMVVGKRSTALRARVTRNTPLTLAYYRKRKIECGCKLTNTGISAE